MAKRKTNTTSKTLPALTPAAAKLAGLIVAPAAKAKAKAKAKAMPVWQATGYIAPAKAAPMHRIVLSTAALARATTSTTGAKRLALLGAISAFNGQPWCNYVAHTVTLQGVTLGIKGKANNKTAQRLLASGVIQLH